jgi:hypothetical protein
VFTGNHILSKSLWNRVVFTGNQSVHTPNPTYLLSTLIFFFDLRQNHRRSIFVQFPQP